MKNFLLTTALFISLTAAAQYGEKDSNRIGISVGVNQFDLNTSNFNTSPEIGWNAGLSVRGNFYNDFDMVFGLQFSENDFTVKPIVPAVSEDVKCKISSAQISLLLSYKFIENHLSVEFGPMLQVNGRITVDEDEETAIVDTHGTTLKDIEDISTFNLYPTVGITAGIRHVRLHVYYQYGVNNMLAKLDNGNGQTFTGHAGILGANIVFYL